MFLGDAPLRREPDPCWRFLTDATAFSAGSRMEPTSPAVRTPQNTKVNRPGWLCRASHIPGGHPPSDQLLDPVWIDLHKAAAFEERARNWGQALPRCVANLIGYFDPHESSATIAYGLYNTPDLSAYKVYRARLHDEPAGRANSDFARCQRFIFEEDRIFPRFASAPPAALVRP